MGGGATRRTYSEIPVGVMCRPLGYTHFWIICGNPIMTVFSCKKDMNIRSTPHLFLKIASGVERNSNMHLLTNNSINWWKLCKLQRSIMCFSGVCLLKPFYIILLCHYVSKRVQWRIQRGAQQVRASSKYWSIRRVPGRTSLTQRDVLPGTHRFARLMRFSLDTYFNSSPIHHLFDLFVEIL